MNTNLAQHLPSDNGAIDDILFTAIASDIRAKGFSIQPMALPDAVLSPVVSHNQAMLQSQFSQAGIGRSLDFQQNNFVRRDEISWITGESEAGQIWLNWTAKLQTFLNRHLFLGLFSFESHFAHYPPGAFYKRHYDAFHGQANRILSIVVYLNPHWPLDAGGELVLYRDDRDVVGIKVTPALGTIVTFLSEEFPHEVLPATQDRYSIAGWYRLNTSINNQIDPSR